MASWPPTDQDDDAVVVENDDVVERFAAECGDDEDVVTIFRDLQRFARAEVSRTSPTLNPRK